MTVLIATDLDRTMIYSPKAVRTLNSTAVEPALVGVEIREGQFESFMTVAAADGYARLAQRPGVVLVPSTTRTVVQYRRVSLPGPAPTYAVTTNGGNILHNGKPDRRWRERLDAASRSECAPLGEVYAEFARRSDPSFVRALRVADELFCYITVRLEKLPEGFVSEWSDWCEFRGWRVSIQGSKIYAVPSVISKSAAIREIADRCSADVIIAAGDGRLDTDLLELADAAIRPRHGELEALGYFMPNLQVTVASGALAGEEIVNWFTSVAEDPASVAVAAREVPDPTY
jgi:hypothetical protein